VLLSWFDVYLQKNRRTEEQKERKERTEREHGVFVKVGFLQTKKHGENHAFP